MFERLKEWARGIRRDVLALYLAARDPRVPWYAKALAALVAAYALSPIDPIPDFIPVLGYLDDMVVIPLGIRVAIMMIPEEVMADLRRQAAGRISEPSKSRAGGVLVVALWVIAAIVLLRLIFRR